MTVRERIIAWVRPSIKTAEDLAKTKILNTGGIAGVVNSLPDFDSFITGDKGFGWLGTNTTFTWIATLKNWHVSQFEYENLPEGIDSDFIEFLLFVWGKVIIFKKGDKFYTTSFIPVEFDIYFNPTKIKIIVPFDTNHKLTNKVMKVDKNCAILYNDQSFLLGNKVFYGSLWRIWPFLKNVVKSYNLIVRNQDLTKKWAKMPFDTASIQIKAMENMMKNDTRLVLPWNQNALLPSNSSRNTRETEDKLEFDDGTGVAWDNYYNHWNELKQMIGMDNNANAKKRERQITDEIEVNNVLSTSMLDIMKKQRQKGLDKANEIWGLNMSVELKREREKKEEEEKMEKELNKMKGREKGIEKPPRKKVEKND